MTENRPTTPLHRICNLAIVAIFVAGLLLPTIDNCFEIDPAPPLVENRNPAARPAWPAGWKGVPAYIKGLEAYYNDHLGFRKWLIRAYDRIHVRVFAVSPIDMVDLGKQGWIFLGKDWVREYYRGTRNLDAAGLEKWRRVHEERRDWLESMGIPYYYLVAPNKSTIYPEYMPDHLNRVTTDTAMDRVVAYLGAHSDFRIIDIRRDLIEAKPRSLLYSAKDSHWNDYGAYIGYKRLMDALAERFPGLRPQPLSEFKVLTTAHPRWSVQTQGTGELICDTDGENLKYIELEPLRPRRARFGYIDRRTFKTEIDDPSLPTAVVIHDSFYSPLYFFVSEHFRRVVYYKRDYLDFPAEVIAREKPDVVIEENVERQLPLPLPPNPPQVRRH
ncbi:MAG: hypothetical protein ABFD69_14655 [Candidatus Sumerlaeia bacterium]